ncbi:MAG TPA: hypothetical protein PKD64_19320 [Pirellulaceae bacterium]|nr:hypothetical protein [Pirellulaceae bacterium]HMO94342.1 hypothetical protein [Pirellulaceae bacterium]HMP69645.1 hypothetical protein [Pirellulaceae bacterium]
MRETRVNCAGNRCEQLSPSPPTPLPEAGRGEKDWVSRTFEAGRGEEDWVSRTCEAGRGE